VPSPTLDTAHQLPFDDFLDGVDVVVMGRRCYEQGLHEDYVRLGKRVVVATSTPQAFVDPDLGVVDFVTDPVATVTAARDQGSRCFVFGGGILVQSFLAAGEIDTLTVGIVPIVLGRGRPLFGGDHESIELRLTDYSIQGGKVRLVYDRRG
jgi:dihydrofolate reductase